MAKEKTNIILLGIYNRRQRLLEMLYTPKELAKELNVSREYIYKSLLDTERIPYIKDETGHLYINGMDVYKWIVNIFDQRKQKKKNRTPFMENEFYCLKCREKKITDNYTISHESDQSVKIAHCPDCGSRMRKYFKEKIQ